MLRTLRSYFSHDGLTRLAQNSLTQLKLFIELLVSELVFDPSTRCLRAAGGIWGGEVGRSARKEALRGHPSDNKSYNKHLFFVLFLFLILFSFYFFR